MATSGTPELGVNEPTTLRTYKRADGELVVGEYAWVADLDFFDDVDEPTEIIEEVWVRQSARSILLPKCGHHRCDEQATYWGLCEKHAREDDPSAFDEEDDTDMNKVR